MLSTVDLDLYAPTVEVHVPVTSAAGPIGAADLAGRLGQAGAAAQPGEVDLEDGLRATGRVRDRPDDDRAPMYAWQPGQRRLDVCEPHQALLEAGGDDGDGLAVGRCPLRRIDHRASRHRAGWIARRVLILDRQVPRAMHHDAGRGIGVAPVRADEHVHRPGGESPQPLHGER
ncbi:hypothetical protein ACFQ1L_15130 [Phytohabitans flavus]|uniref:hypothetical protein n=1 Tax=Phytohabitans flavus TaxID=1076124 RepID=UPI001565C2D9|nr:hypothetical protein [Phytohabitans flavus]